MLTLGSYSDSQVLPSHLEETHLFTCPSDGLFSVSCSSTELVAKGSADT